MSGGNSQAGNPGREFPGGNSRVEIPGRKFRSARLIRQSGGEPARQQVRLLKATAVKALFCVQKTYGELLRNISVLNLC